MVLTGDQKRKIYWKVFYLLAALTAIEVALVMMPLPYLLQTSLVVIASLAKAFFVGWIYMHLNHETRGLQIMMLLPLAIAFFYAVFLIWDAPHRPANYYVESPERHFGQRNLADRQVDEFGNTIMPAAQTDSHHKATTPPAEGGHEGEGAPATSDSTPAEVRTAPAGGVDPAAGTSTPTTKPAGKSTSAPAEHD